MAQQELTTWQGVLTRLRRPPSVHFPKPLPVHVETTPAPPPISRTSPRRRAHAPVVLPLVRPLSVSDRTPPPLQPPPVQVTRFEVVTNNDHTVALPDPTALPRIPRARSMPMLRTRLGGNESSAAGAAPASGAAPAPAPTSPLLTKPFVASYTSPGSDAESRAATARAGTSSGRPTKRLNLHQVSQIIESLPWLQRNGLQKRDLNLIAQLACGSQRRLKRFQVLYREGSPSNLMYIVGRGQIGLRAAGDEPHIGLTAPPFRGQLVEQGGTFGESALLPDAPPRRATATALLPTILLCLGPLEELLAPPKVVKSVRPPPSPESRAGRAPKGVEAAPASPPKKRPSALAGVLRAAESGSSGGLTGGPCSSLGAASALQRQATTSIFAVAQQASAAETRAEVEAAKDAEADASAQRAAKAAIEATSRESLFALKHKLYHALERAQLPDVDAALAEAEAAKPQKSSSPSPAPRKASTRVRSAQFEGTRIEPSAAGHGRASHDDISERVVQHQNLRSYAEGVPGVSAEYAIDLMDRWKKAHPEALCKGLADSLPVVSVRPPRPGGGRRGKLSGASAAPTAATPPAASMADPSDGSLSVPQFLAISTLSPVMSGWYRHLKGKDTEVSSDALVMEEDLFASGGKFASAESMQVALAKAQELEEAFDRTVAAADQLGWWELGTHKSPNNHEPEKRASAIEIFKKVRTTEAEQARLRDALEM